MKELQALWDEDPLEQFKAFVTTEAFTAISKREDGEQQRVLGENTVKVYTAMFSKFARWLQRHHKKMSQLTAAEIIAFVKDGGEDAPELNSSIERKYFRLLDRCYIHLKIVPSPAQQASGRTSHAQLAKKDKGMVVLTPEQQEQFIAALPSTEQKHRGHGVFTGWKRRRDRAMQLVMLKSGIKPAEAVGLHIDELDRTPTTDGFYKLRIRPDDKHDTSYKHEALLPKFVVDEVDTWLKERARLKIPGTLMFPGGLDGRMRSASGAYQQVQNTFARAGIDAGRQGGRTLRNTYAREELAKGTPVKELTERLGLALERSTLLYADKKPGGPAESGA